MQDLYKFNESTIIPLGQVVRSDENEELERVNKAIEEFLQYDDPDLIESLEKCL